MAEGVLTLRDVDPDDDPKDVGLGRQDTSNPFASMQDVLNVLQVKLPDEQGAEMTVMGMAARYTYESDQLSLISVFDVMRAVTKVSIDNVNRDFAALSAHFPEVRSPSNHEG